MTVSSARPSSDSESPSLATGEIHICLARRTPSRGSDRFLRQVLAAYTGLSPGQLVFQRGEHGKPMLADSSLQFSLSHSRDRIACAVAVDVPLGLDLEYRDRERDVMKLARRFYSAEENRQLAELGDGERGVLFYDLWVLKEAWIKARGGALGSELEATAFHLDESAGLLEKLPAVDEPRPYCCLLRAPWNFSLAVCCLSPPQLPPRISGFYYRETGEIEGLSLPQRAGTKG